MLYFDWDPQKALENLSKHGVSFGAASAALEDSHAVDWEDQVTEGEVRHLSTGMAEGEAIVTVCYTLEPIEGTVDEIARIISARKAMPAERKEYEQSRATSSWHSFE